MSRHTARDVLSRMNLADVLISPAHQEVVISNLQQLAAVDDESLEEAAAERRMGELAMAYGYRQPSRDKSFAYSDGTAIIPVHGTLINRFFGSWGFVTGYNAIRSQLNDALDDEDVERIIFDVNSYGGEAAGCFELADEIRAARDRKSLLAVVDSNCCSAAYALASSAARVVVTPSGQAGSIGVIAMHVNVSKALENMGIEVTIIADGPRKADGNPFEPLSPEALKDIRASVAKRYGEFCELVVKNRGIDSQAVRATESRTYRADEALTLRLIDAVQTPTEAVASFLAEMGSDEPEENEDDDMADTPNTDKAAAPDQAALDAAAEKARTDEQARVGGILNCEEAKTRPALARHLATKTRMSVDDAKTTLAAAAEEDKPAEAEAEDDKDGKGDKGDKAGKSPFEDAMNNGDNPEVGADTEQGDKGDKAGKPSRAQAAMAAAGFGAPKKA